MIRVSSPNMVGREREYVNDCLDRNELSSVGAYVERFERAFAIFCNTEHAVACCNGTAALHLALLCSGIEQGSKVIVPALTYVATANAVRYCGADPVFVDVDYATWTLNVERVKQLCREQKIDAVVPVHLYGQAADMDHLLQTGLLVVEDAAQAHGARYGRAPVGSLGDAGVFSFYGNKIITCGEGGMVTTNDPILASTLRLYRGQGVDPKTRYGHKVVGYNYRMTNIQAAIGLAQLESVVEAQAWRTELCNAYRAELSDVAEQQLRSEGSVDWLYTCLVPSNRDGVMRQMALDGIETRPMFPVIPTLTPYRNGIKYPASQYIADHGISLPTHREVTPDVFDKIVTSFRKAVRRAA